MKKTIASLMLAGSVLGGLVAPTLSVSASVTDNGDGTQTVTGQQNAEVEFKGQIGEIDPGNTDPTDPDAPKPGTDWIKVKLPTKVIYYSTSESSHKTIDSGNYKVDNLSSYPVDVQLTGFVGEDGKSAPNIDKIGTLDLKAGDTTINLVKDTAVISPNGSIFKLGANKKAINPQDKTGLPSDSSFKFEGVTAKDADLKNRTTLENKLEITLVGLDADGHVPSK